ncbi:hypothetical protein V5799_008299 [Amblyomma americanum]|uniref:Uncharacterized protein n=1 Tax=Amblyomma americanum TaxID=6943 RepID=A0AAQ4FFA5_AMBAM
MEKKSPSQWTEPRELLAAQQRPGPPPPKPEQYLGIDASTLYSLSLQSDATDRGSQWAPFVYACGLLVLIFGFLLIYYLSRCAASVQSLRARFPAARISVNIRGRDVRATTGTQSAFRRYADKPASSEWC